MTLRTRALGIGVSTLTALAVATTVASPAHAANWSGYTGGPMPGKGSFTDSGNKLCARMDPYRVADSITVTLRPANGVGKSFSVRVTPAAAVRCTYFNASMPENKRYIARWSWAGSYDGSYVSKSGRFKYYNVTS